VNAMAQNWSQAKFEHYGVEHGLSSSTIYCLHRDSKGFLWVGTDNGLNRYDGYKFHTFRNQLADPNSISNNHIQSIFEDKEGILWIATWKFMNSYNPQSGKFKVYTYPTDSISELDCRTNHIEAWNKDTLLISTNRGPALFSKRTGVYTFFRVKPQAKIAEPDYVFGIKRLYQNEVLVSTFDDLYTINPYHNSTHKVDISDLKIHKNYAHVTGKITAFKAHEWLIETWNMDILIYNDKTKKLRNHFFNKPYVKLDYGGGALTILKTNDGFLFGTNGNGIYVTDSNLNEKFHIKFDEKFAHSLSSNYVTSILCDNEGIYWIGTDKGLNKFDPQKQKFNFNRFRFKSPYFNDEDRVYDIFITKKHQLIMQGIWGSYYIDTVNQKAIFLNQLNTKNFHNFFGKPFYISDSLICLPRAGGFQTFYFKSSQSYLAFDSLKEYPIKKHFNSPNDVKYFDQHYYVLFNNDRIYKVDVKTGKFETIKIMLPNKQELKAERFNTLEPIINKPNCYYLGTSPNGLFEVNLKNFSARKIEIDIVPKTDIINITNICQHNNGNIWLATEFHGVIFYDAKSKKWQELEAHKLIANNHIRNLVLVGDSELCIIINDAFYSLNLNTNKLNIVGVDEGLGEESMPSSFLLHQNTAFFAHEKGYLSAPYPSLYPSVTNNGIIFTEIFSGNHQSYLSTHHYKVHLPYPENSLRISFAQLNFHAPNQHKFIYKFGEPNAEWIDLGTNHELVLHKLPYGANKLYIKLYGNDQQHEAQMAILYLTVEAPFYLKTWFIVISILIFIGLFFLIYRILLMRKIAVLNTRDTIARDLHDEVGSALTSISYLSEMGKIQQSGGNATFDKIGETSRNITSLMNDIIWAINPDKDNALSLIQRINYFIQEHQHHKDLIINFDYTNKLMQHAFSMSERKSLYLIFKEALNNAFKYANATKIQIRLLKEGQSITLDIEDNGQGIVKSNQKGNGLHNMEKRAADIKAIFEIISKPGEGTTIRVKLNHQNWGT
jgi:hypothetical protein